jgi:hypothetical protein
MKRGIESISGGAVNPISKRSSGDEGDDNQESSAISSFVLVTKSRNLTLELMRSKRELTEARKELDLMRKKSQEMESLVSLIQRSWSQIDIDSSLLLDSLGDSEVKLPEQGDSELLYKLLNSSSRWLLLDPTNVNNVTNMEVDQWSSNVEVDKSKESALQAESDVKLTVKSPHKGGPVAGSIILVPEQVEHHLQGHASFTMSLLERLCAVLNEISDIGNREDILRPLTQAKENSSIILTLQDNILKLRSDIIESRALLQLKENEKVKLEKRLDKALVTIKDLEERGLAIRNASPTEGNNADASTGGAGHTDGQVQSAQAASTEGSGTSVSNAELQQARAFEKELQEQIELLEKQLTESESAKAKVERQMTEKLAKPFAQTETQVSDMRKTLEDLKTHFKQRLAEYVKQIETVTKERDDYLFVVTQLESVTAAKVASVVSATEQEIARVKAEKLALENRISAMQANADVAQQLKTQVQEWQHVDSARQQRIAQLEKDIQHWHSTVRVAEQNLQHARKREQVLEQIIVQCQIPVPSQLKLTLPPTTNSDNSSGTENNAGDSHTDKRVLVDQASQLIIQQLQERGQELEKELQDTKASIHDFLTEIDAVSNQEIASRQQSERLLQQIHDYQSIQRDALQENIRLQSSVEDMKCTMKELEQRMEMMKNLMFQQESTVSDIRNVEQSTRQELQCVKHEFQRLQQERDVMSVQLQESGQKVKELDNEYQKTMKRNQELHQRCDELSKQAEQERKRRFDEGRLHAKKERQQQKKAAQFSSDTAASSLSGTKRPVKDSDQDMLDMTLEMLRCSVCHDRFKNVTITRCFHMFCRECIDENLRNRSRKCPACGEKFGQDDVAQVYFTH